VVKNTSDAIILTGRKNPVRIF